MDIVGPPYGEVDAFFSSRRSTLRRLFNQPKCAECGSGTAQTSCDSCGVAPGKEESGEAEGQ